MAADIPELALGDQVVRTCQWPVASGDGALLIRCPSNKERKGSLSLAVDLSGPMDTRDVAVRGMKRRVAIGQ